MPVTTPTMPGMTYEQSLYRGPALAQLRILKQQMQLGGLVEGERTIRINDDVEIYCRICFNDERVYVRVKPKDEFILIPSGFISTPRLFGLNDGYALVNGTLTDQGSGMQDYPLDDATSTSQALSVEHPDAGHLDRTRQVYGNIDWIGWPSGATPPPVLTWKGPSGRTIPCDISTLIPGYTTGDISFDELSPPYYTCFGSSVYRDGAIFATVPVTGDVGPKVLGCALTRSGVLVCVVNNHYSGQAGFFEEVWKYTGGVWTKIFSAGGFGRPAHCWFFNKSGTRCTQGTKEYVLSADLTSVSVVNHSNGSGTYTVVAENDHTGPGSGLVAQEITTETVTITHNGEYATYSDYKADTRVQASVHVSDVTRRTRATDNTVTSVESKAYATGVKPQSTAFITGPETITVGAQYRISGDLDVCCTTTGAVWTLSGGGEMTTGGLVTKTGCGVGVISVTVGEGCDEIASFTGRVASGQWALVSSSYARVGSVSAGGDPNCSVNQAYLDWGSTHPVLNGSAVECSMYYGGYTPIPGTHEVVSGDTKVVTACGDFLLSSTSGCGFGCGGGSVTKTPASGGSCPSGYPVLVQVYKWVC